MHKTTNKKRYENPCLIIAEVECMNLMALSGDPDPELPGGTTAPPKNEESNDDGLVKGMSLWDEGW